MPTATPPDDARRLAQRLLALEESHTFLARSLEVLSGEIHEVGGALQDLIRRVNRLDQRLDQRPDTPPTMGPTGFDDPS